jgi:hypothetical protein
MNVSFSVVQVSRNRETRWTVLMNGDASGRLLPLIDYLTQQEAEAAKARLERLYGATD